MCCGNGAACRGRALLNDNDRDVHVGGLVYGVAPGAAPNTSHALGVESRRSAAPQDRTYHDQRWLVESLDGGHTVTAPARIIRYNPGDRQTPWAVESSPTVIPTRAPADDGLGRGCAR